MKHAKILVGLGLALFVLGISSTAAGQEKATAQEVVSKVQQAADTLSKSATAPAGEASLTQFNQEESPWVWKDTYIFVLDCDKMTNAAHPLRPDIRNSALSSIKDPKGNSIFPNPKGLCEAARKPSGAWVEYWWAKPGEKEGSRKLSYLLGAKGTPYVVGAGVYDDKATIAELSKLSSKK